MLKHDKCPGFPPSLIPLLVGVLAVGLLTSCAGTRTPPRLEPPPHGACASRLTREVLEQSLTAGIEFLLNHQRPEGNFNYLYDWKTQTLSTDDSQVRQAGTAWGLTLIYQARPEPRIGAAIERALDFFRQHSRLDARGGRYIAYPGANEGSTGTVALVSLALIDYLRAENPERSTAHAARLREDLDEYLRFLVDARTSDERWHRSYSLATGDPYGGSSPYFDGEALLALTKAARHLGRDDLRAIVRASADAGYRLNVVEARAANPDSDVTKGYYQWSSMTYFELAQSGWKDTERYGDYLLELADWMIDVHRTLTRTRNTGYAYEGIIPAYRLAVERGLIERARHLSCVIDRGLEKLTSWQVGSPIAVPFIPASTDDDPLAFGGIQNHAREAGLRIDVAQHQMHAVLLALRYVYTAESD